MIRKNKIKRLEIQRTLVIKPVVSIKTVNQFSLLILILLFPAYETFSADWKQDFVDPPLHYAPRPLWFWNNTTVTPEGIREQMRLSRDRCGYGGFGILPFGKNFKPEYLSDVYFDHYRVALQMARELDMTMCIYDEYGFPSGSAGAIHGDGVPRFSNLHPEFTLKRLDKHEWEAVGGDSFSCVVPPGQLMSVVAMNTENKKRINLTKFVQNSKVEWQVPEGVWKIMVFVCVKDGDPNVDYLDPEAVSRFIQMTHQAYYDRFKEYFGTTIDGSFFDETTMYRAEGRVWTGDFNRKFHAAHGFDPAPYYPALWYDIGPETQAARNYLFGFRTQLYASGYPKIVQEWCTDHGITLTGHQDQEEVLNPVSVSGDLMKCFQYQDIPGVDKIGGNRPAERFYKIISSAATNWDHSLVMSETYGAMGDIPWKTIYTIAMEQYTKGINMLIPHAVWYDHKNVTFKPELSWRHPLYRDELPEFNRYMSRLNVMLQNNGRHVSDIAVLYPIATLQASHYLDGPLGYYKGGVEVPEADYVDIGELLSTDICRDYTYIHPEVLENKIRLDDNVLLLENTIQSGEFNVLIVPGHQTIFWSNLKKIKQFFDQGGQVIATGTLPTKSAEFGYDQEVNETVHSMFSNSSEVISNENGGRAVFLQKPTADTMKNMLNRMMDVPDVTFERDGEFRYIHKVYQGKHVYFFANLNDRSVSSTIQLRGKLIPEIWNPHLGEITRMEYKHQKRNGIDVTEIELELPPIQSVFLVSDYHV